MYLRYGSCKKVQIEKLCSSAIYKQCLSDSGCVGEVTSIIFEHECYISALEHIKMLILSIYVLLACINAIYKYGHAWVI